MNKMKYLIVTCLAIALLSYGVIAFANSGTSADSDNIVHVTVSGQFIALQNENSKIKVNVDAVVKAYPLDDAIWILRDHKKAALDSLKSGDKIEFILNSNNKVAYIKAYSEAYLLAEAAALLATPAPTASPAPTLAPAATVKPVPSPTAAPKLIKPDKKVKSAKKFDGKDDKDHDFKRNDDRDGKSNKHNGRNNHDKSKKSA